MTIIDDLKERCDAIEDALNKKIEDLNKAVKPTVEGTKSTDSRIERCIQSVDSKWNEFEVAYHALKGKLVPNAQNPLDCPVASQKTRFDALYRSQQDAIMNAYDELDERKEKAEREKRNQDDAAKIDEENESKKRKINSLIGLHKERIKKSFSSMKSDLEKGVQDLQVLLSFGVTLDQEKASIQEVIVPLFNRLIDLQADQVQEEAIEKQRNDYVLESHDLVMEIKGSIAKNKSSITPIQAQETNAIVDSTANVATSSARGGYFGYFNKKNFPMFSGKYRDYPEFKKYWSECVQPKYEDPYQRHEISQCVPEVMKPMLRNCENMIDVWKILDEEYGNNIDICPEVIGELTSFKYTTKTPTHQFLELYTKYNHAKQDLKQVNKLSELNNLTTLKMISERLPGELLKREYAKSRALKKGQAGVTELDIFDAFMLEQYNVEKERSKFDENEVKSPKFFRGHCNNCSGYGHKTNDCPTPKNSTPNSSQGQSHRNGKVNVVGTKKQPKACPACKGQHSVKKGNDTWYKTSLYFCNTFRNMSPDQRANLVQAANGCALCLDWTGTHQRDNCSTKIGKKGVQLANCSITDNNTNSKCNKKHHTMLHGTGNQFCNLIQACRSSNIYQAIPTENDLLAAKQDVLLQLQSIPAKSLKADSTTDVQCLTFWDNGSTIALVREEFAENLGLKGTKCTQWVQTAGREFEKWDTTAYFIYLLDREGNYHKILAYSIPVITSSVEYTSVDGLEIFFKQIKVQKQSLARPSGQVDLLIGLKHAALHPRCIQVSDQLRLLQSQFGTGYLLDGYHPKIDQAPIFINNLAHKYCHSVEIISNKENAKVHLLKGVKVTNKHVPMFIGEDDEDLKTGNKALDFMEAEQLGTHQPKRCSLCQGCSKCSIRGQNMSRRDQVQLKAIEDGISYDREKKKCTANYPYIRDPTVLEDNFEQAKRIQEGIEKQIIRKGQLEKYNEQIKDAESRGLIQKLSKEDLEKWDGLVNYITHHAVLKPGSTTTPVRVVSNSSLNNNWSGVSYNDCLAKGPNSLTPLFEVLITWRTYKDCVVWDLSKAYNSIDATEEHWHMRRLLWRWGKQDDEWSIFVLKDVHFGDRPAAMCLEIVKGIARDEGKAICEDTSKVMEKGSYVDDSIAGGKKEFIDKMIGKVTVQDNKYSYSGTVAQIYQQVGMSLKVMVRSGEQDQGAIDKLGDHLLGHCWKPREDKILFKIAVNLSNKRGKKVKFQPDITPETIDKLKSANLTKRILLGIISSIYDPLGLLSPLTIKYKIEMGKLHKMKDIEWDTILEGDVEKEWKNLLEEMVNLPEFIFERSVKPQDCDGPPELFIYYDGGKPAFSATAFARFKKIKPAPDGQTHECRLLSSKAKVGDKSIPRMETDGLTAGSRLVTALLPGMVEPPSDIYFVGDSSATISLVDCDTKTLTPYFDSRIGEILEHREEWAKICTVHPIMHTPGILNIADICTKGKAKPEHIAPDSEWQLGPRYLRYDDKSAWPLSRTFSAKVPDECRLIKIYTIQIMSEKIFLKITEIMTLSNSLLKVKLILARFILMCLTGKPESSRVNPSVKAIGTAMHLMEMASMDQTKTAFEDNKLRCLSPFWSKGICVTKGRLAKGLQPVLGVEHLTILTRQSRLAYLVMVAAHNKNHHGPKITLHASRLMGYWIHHGMSLAKQVCSKCLICIRASKSMAEQRMGDLPIERVGLELPPWTHVCLDLMAPISVKAMVNSRATMKCWPIVVVCMQTGATHIMLSHNYGTEAFMLQWSGFTALRGHPKLVISDRGSQLVSAASKFPWSEKEDPSKWDWSSIASESAKHQTTWKFVPPGCQWRNGLSESRVKAAKITLSQIMSQTALSYAEMVNLLYRVANIINDRPIGIKTLTNDDFIPLTANHLLLGRAAAHQNYHEFLEELTEAEEINLTRRQAYTQNLLNSWWKLYYVQVFSNLLPFRRFKDTERHRNFQEGDVCFLKYDGKVQSSYRLCRVSKIIPDEEDVVRTVEVILRPRNKAEKLLPFKSKKPNVIEVGVQRLALLVPNEELPNPEVEE